MKKFCILVPVSGNQLSKDDLRIKGLLAQTSSDWVAYVLPATKPANAEPLPGESRFSYGPEGLDSFAKLINWAVKNGDAEFILPLADGVVLAPEALQKFAALFASNAKTAGAFSSYAEIKGTAPRNVIKLYPHEGAPHERFDFGFVRVYRASALQEIGGVRTDLVHAAEYDTDLRLADNKSIDLIDEPLYDVIIPETPEQAAGAKSVLHSPGKGKLGGFSYIFYPADMEKEITGVFEETLKRRGAWIDHETVEVPYPSEPYPVLATVVIPVLNRQKYIGNAIDRVLDGTFKDFEVVVVDNKSTDGTQDVVKAYAAKDKRVRLIERNGGSIASALNEGIRNARGKYICQLDSDDEYTPDTLEMMVSHMESHPKCGLAISYYALMDENRNEVTGIDPITHSGYTRNQILRRDGGGALRVFPKVVLEEMGYYDEEHFGNFGEDYDMVLKTGEKYDVDRVHKVLYRYRRHSDNTDVTRDPLMKIQNKNNARLNALARRKKINAKRKESAGAK